MRKTLAVLLGCMLGCTNDTASSQRPVVTTDTPKVPVVKTETKPTDHTTPDKVADPVVKTDPVKRPEPGPKVSPVMPPSKPVSAVKNSIVPSGAHQYVTLTVTWASRSRSSQTSPLRCSDQGPPSELAFSASRPATSSVRLQSESLRLSSQSRTSGSNSSR